MRKIAWKDCMRKDHGRMKSEKVYYHVVRRYDIIILLNAENVMIMKPGRDYNGNLYDGEWKIDSDGL